jgi:hypothetical protein
MISTKSTRIFDFLKSGLVSASEVANFLLFDLLSASDIDPVLLSAFESLPGDVRREFLRLLQRIRDTDFHWAPFYIGPPLGLSDRMKFTEKLRQVCGLLGQFARRSRYSTPYREFKESIPAGKESCLLTAAN